MNYSDHGNVGSQLTDRKITRYILLGTYGQALLIRELTYGTHANYAAACRGDYGPATQSTALNITRPTRKRYAVRHSSSSKRTYNPDLNFANDESVDYTIDPLLTDL